MDTLIIFGAKYLWILSVILFVWLFYKSDRIRFIKMSLVLPASYLLGILARALYENPRPFVVENIQPLIEHSADNGFPSDHTLLVASIASVATFFDKKMGLILWVITILVGVSRVLARVHHPIDIVGSIAVSIIASWMIYFFLNKKKENGTTINTTQQ